MNVKVRVFATQSGAQKTGEMSQEQFRPLALDVKPQFFRECKEFADSVSKKMRDVSGKYKKIIQEMMRLKNEVIYPNFQKVAEEAPSEFVMMITTNPDAITKRLAEFAPEDTKNFCELNEKRKQLEEELAQLDKVLLRIKRLRNGVEKLGERWQKLQGYRSKYTETICDDSVSGAFARELYVIHERTTRVAQKFAMLSQELGHLRESMSDGNMLKDSAEYVVTKAEEMEKELEELVELHRLFSELVKQRTQLESLKEKVVQKEEAVGDLPKRRKSAQELQWRADSLLALCEDAVNLMKKMRELENRHENVVKKIEKVERHGKTAPAGDVAEKERLESELRDAANKLKALEEEIQQLAGELGISEKNVPAVHAKLHEKIAEAKSFEENFEVILSKERAELEGLKTKFAEQEKEFEEAEKQFRAKLTGQDEKSKKAEAAMEIAAFPGPLQP